MDIKNECNQYCHLISHQETINAEFILWRKKRENHDIKDLPSNVIDALNNCNFELFPNIFELLKPEGFCINSSNNLHSRKDFFNY
ncbi:UNVERIFIED_CONTAM: hypothetical protein RMT77_018454 [Armadillidium vulgare]